MKSVVNVKSPVATSSHENKVTVFSTMFGGGVTVGPGVGVAVGVVVMVVLLLATVK